MKIAFSLLLAVLVSWQAHAQQLMAPLPVNTTTGLITYMAVVPTPGVIQASLLARAKVWANRISVPAKSPLVVSELGTDVLVVAGSQPISPSFDVAPQRLYFLAQVSMREGRYHYRIEELTLETGSSTGPTTYQTAEAAFLQQPPPKATGNSSATRLRRAFDDALAQAGATLQRALTTPLAPPNEGGLDW